jgi:hypothetical protein
MDGPRIALVACGASKLPRRAAAKDLYTGPLFRTASAYAEACCDHWYVLSARHGLVEPETELEPYDQSLSDMPCSERDRWGIALVRQLISRWGAIANVRWVILAGKPYVNAIRPELIAIANGHRRIAAAWLLPELPLVHLAIGMQMQWLKQEVADHVR